MYKGQPVTSIGEDAFLNCSGLTRIENIGQVTTIDATNANNVSQAFSGCTNLNFVRLPNTITALGTSANPFHSCGNIETFICEATTPPSLGGKFSGRFAGTIYVPDASVTAYREASGWVDYADRIKPLSEYTE